MQPQRCSKAIDYLDVNIQMGTSGSWEAEQNHQLAWSFDSLPRTSLPKNKTKIPFYSFSQGRQNDRTEELYKFGRLGFTELLL